MNSILIRLLYVTALSSGVIGAVMLIKAVYRNNVGIKAISLLWTLVLVRLLMPFSIESPVHLVSIFAKTEIADDETISSDNEELPYEYTAPETNNTYEINAPTTENYVQDYSVFEEQDTVTQKITTLEKIKTFIKSIDISALITSIWAVGGLWMIFISISQLIVFSIRKEGTCLVSKELLDAFKMAKGKLNIKESIRIIESDKIDVPITYGLLSPRILIPAKMAASMDKDKITLILMHELMHIKRMDILKNYLWLIAKAIHWFNPLVWIAYKQYIGDMEITCDYYVTQRLNDDDKAAYTQSLLEATKLMQGNKKYNAPIMLSFCEENTKLRRRIMNILQPIKQSRKQLFVIGILIVIIIIGCFTTACQESSEKDTSSPLGNLSTVTPTATPELLGTDENGNHLYATKTPTQTYVTTDARGNIINATYTPEYPTATPEAYSQEIKELWSETKTLDDCDVTVNMLLTEFFIPNSNSMPTAQSIPTKFDLDFASRAVYYFLGETYYKNILTKDEYKNRLSLYENLIDGVELSEYDQQASDEYLEYLNDCIADAPNENEAGNIQFKTKGEQTVISLKSYDENDNLLELIVDNESDTQTTFYYSRDGLDYEVYELGENTYVSDEKYDEYIEAEKTANQVVADIAGDTMALSYMADGVIASAYATWLSQEELISDPELEECYIYYFTPIINNERGIYGQLAIGSDVEGESQYTYDPFLTEYIKVVVDKDGVREFWWVDYSEIVNIEEQEINFMTIEQIVDAFKENIFSVAIWHDSIAESTEINISGIKNGIIRIMQEDGTYQLTPVYAFKGTQTSIWPGGKEIVRYTDADNAYFMIINAIDGSVIDLN